MKPFEMEPVLRYRKQTEDTARQNLLKSQLREEEIREHRDDLCRQLDILHQQIREMSVQGTDADQLLRHHIWMDTVKARLASAEKKLAREKKRSKRKRARLLTASKERKALEKLRDQQNHTYQQLQRSREAASIDETAILRFNHKP